jgi:DNA-binding LacI/PurR family transcriptional regulator
MAVKITDIAKNCGVSTGLVSRIINGDITVRCNTLIKKKVLDEVEKLGYIPNIHAKSLSTMTVDNNNKQYRIGYISYNSTCFKGHPYFDKIIEGVVSEIKSSGYELTIGTYMTEAYQLFKQNKPLCEGILDGLILFGEITDNRFFEYLLKQAKYVTTICNLIINDNIDFVGCDLSDTIKIILEHIKNNGYNEIGLICGNEDYRKSMTLLAAESIGLKINTNFLLIGKYDSNSTYEVVNSNLKENKPPKVICCLNDEMAIGCIKALQNNGYKVPQDVSVTGHDDIMRANYCEVPLTTVRIYKEEIGKLAVAILEERLTSKRKFGIKVIIPGKLVKRDSLISNKEG